MQAVHPAWAGKPEDRAFHDSSKGDDRCSHKGGVRRGIAYIAFMGGNGGRASNLSSSLLLRLRLGITLLGAITVSGAADLCGEEAVPDQTFGVQSGAAFGSFIFGGAMKHDFAFVTGHYGWVLDAKPGEGSWLDGRWLFLAEATIGREFHPGKAWAVSLTPVVRYLFGYPGKFVPFFEAGFGLTWTDLGRPDLGSDLQFNSQGGAGFYWFFQKDFALSIQYRFIHYSNAGIRKPNGGVNLHGGLIGISWFY